MLQVQNLTKAFGEQVLFQAVTWHVSQGDRVGLAGPNGAGKTTLLRILAGLEPADEGQVIMPRATTVGFLPQEGLRHQGCSLFEEAMSVFADVLALREEQRELEETMGRLDPGAPGYQAVLRRYGECQETWERQGGFSLEARVDEVLRGLGFPPEEFSHSTESFSGGWQMRIAIAKLLLSRPNLLLLDEPTNHLDLEARNWLEDYLAGYPHAVILVSHDRYFLDRVVTRMTEIDRRRLADYPGNYTHYLDLRQKELTELRARATRQEEEIERVKRFIDRFRYQATRAAQVQSRIKMLEKIERIEVPPERKPFALRLPQPVRSGRIALELAGVSKRYARKEVFRQVSLLFERGDKVALIGPNGAGKSTLMRLLAGVESPDSGDLRSGHNVTTAYFSQDRSFDLDEEKTVLAEMREASPLNMVPQLRSILGAFLFRGDEVEKKINVLSGGEKSRLALAKMLLRPANVLLLDEPTNHLDLDSKDVLLKVLQRFTGTMVFVSHDRHFIDELATKVAEVGGGGVRLYWGNYEDYRRANEAGRAAGGAKEVSAGLAGPAKGKKARRARAVRSPAAGSRGAREGRAHQPFSPEGKESRRQRRELDRLEEAIAEKETAVASLEGRMAVPGFYEDPHRASEVVATHESLKADLDRLYREWERLAARREGA